MAKERKVPDFTPDQLEQIQSINQRVLNKPADEPKPVAKPIAPKPMLPSWYAQGGKVDTHGRFGFNKPGKYSKR